MPTSGKAEKKPKELNGKAEQATGKAVGSTKLTAKGKLDETEARSAGSIKQGARRLKGGRS